MHSANPAGASRLQWLRPVRRVADVTNFKMQSALVVFLRGCNVGGHKTFRPTLLAEQLKHYDVVNIGAAGTFVIRRRTSHARLRADLLRRLPFEAEVIICEGQDLISVASANPFVDEPIRS